MTSTNPRYVVHELGHRYFSVYDTLTDLAVCTRTDRGAAEHRANELNADRQTSRLRAHETRGWTRAGRRSWKKQLTPRDGDQDRFYVLEKGLADGEGASWTLWGYPDGPQSEWCGDTVPEAIRTANRIISQREHWHDFC